MFNIVKNLHSLLGRGGGGKCGIFETVLSSEFVVGKNYQTKPLLLILI